MIASKIWFKSIPKKDRIAVCGIAKYENRYVREWVENYLSLGFDTVIIFDNNDIDGERFDEVISDYIDAGKVIVVDYRGKKSCQLAAYDECYKRFRDKYDWIAFFDLDEHLTLKCHANAKEYLNSAIFDKTNIVHINWMCYGDSGNLRYEAKDCLSRFASPIPYDAPWRYDFPENNHIKSIVRGGLMHIYWSGALNPHTPKAYYRRCDSVGKECDDAPFVPYNFEMAYLRHYMTKTIEEWCDVKMLRGYPDQSTASAVKFLTIDRFFMVNERTPEKERIIQEKMATMMGSNEKDS